MVPLVFLNMSLCVSGTDFLQTAFLSANEHCLRTEENCEVISSFHYAPPDFCGNRWCSFYAGVVSNISQCQITHICASARARSCKVSCTQVFIYLIFISSVTVKVRFKVRVRFPHVAQISYCELFGSATYVAWHGSPMWYRRTQLLTTDAKL